MTSAKAEKINFLTNMCKYNYPGIISETMLSLFIENNENIGGNQNLWWSLLSEELLYPILITETIAFFPPVILSEEKASIVTEDSLK